ncbi:hypothetical protein QIT82_gp22 [Pseudomonas phage psageK9]|uniref:Uncharacterized protein n=2 Tax=Readingvirus TaxID=3152626 RepID=A0A6M3TDW9_9CAUD|nr:hypothetical protein [Pseudomonas syringae]YP_010773137.1 hypothetical protein QIT81_gp25 [Pseudomonas phage MR15]YP_010773228.1 hypothetical protein QIT82_gp22 [Pseudomonas phage psageK9]QJD55087.1 hypothetical protein Psm1vBMR13_gp25c [Pseudomonas phage MR13]QXV71602.1 hypothetical protein psageB2_025c [Pseudomonas phage psageB2]MDG6423771.1 hypothetical protein [Pseudomonas syringae pv. actinidiae]MDG6439152.1 hypothetical protein [Pseudomonas syringae pv. actinidiae]QJD55239.1 hypothe
MSQLTAENATHRLSCVHRCKWTKYYYMPCHVIKNMPGGRVKVLVFGERNWKGREQISRIRYVEAYKVEVKL